MAKVHEADVAAAENLEIQRTFTAMGNCLHRLCKEHAWFFQLADTLPVRR